MGRTLIMMSLISALSAFGGAKEDFIAAVKSQCKKSEGDAKALMKPGRTGNVIQFKLCNTPTIDAGGGCTLKCNKSGATVGG